MKKLLLVISFTLLSFMAFSQSNGEYNYSLGVRGYNYMQMPKLFNQSNSDNYLTSYFNSYIVKFNDNLYSYRLNGGYLKKNLRFVNTCENCELVDGEMKDFSFKMGFEKNFNYAVIQPYFALDLGYRSNKFDGYATNNNQAKMSMDVTPANNVRSTKDGVTLSPGFGIKINPIKQISIFAESNLEIFWNKTTEDRVSQDAANTLTNNKYRRTDLLINPVSVGIQIHLDAKN